MKTATKRFSVAQLDEIDATECPCGTARRAFGDSDEVASVHLVNISREIANDRLSGWLSF